VTAGSGGPDYLVVEGPIGVGKTSLVTRLAERLGHNALLEAAEENPFLPRFYREGRRAAFPTQLFFLFQRMRQVESLRQGDLFQRGVVADFMLEKDRLFASVTLDRDELRLYEEVYARMAAEAPAPDLVVYLQAPVEVLITRVRRRGRPDERAITGDYLRALSDAYTRYFTHYDRSPLLIINAAVVNPVHRPDDFELLVERILAHRSGRGFFNPSPLLL
jgi:deoxyadenosine/deoxycytidine kinase